MNFDKCIHLCNHHHNQERKHHHHQMLSRFPLPYPYLPAAGNHWPDFCCQKAWCFSDQLLVLCSARIQRQDAQPAVKRKVYKAKAHTQEGCAGERRGRERESGGRKSQFPGLFLEAEHGNVVLLEPRHLLPVGGELSSHIFLHGVSGTVIA